MKSLGGDFPSKRYRGEAEIARENHSLVIIQNSQFNLLGRVTIIGPFVRRLPCFDFRERRDSRNLHPHSLRMTGDFRSKVGVFVFGNAYPSQQNFLSETIIIDSSHILSELWSSNSWMFHVGIAALGVQSPALRSMRTCVGSVCGWMTRRIRMKRKF